MEGMYAKGLFIVAEIAFERKTAWLIIVSKFSMKNSVW